LKNGYGDIIGYSPSFAISINAAAPVGTLPRRRGTLENLTAPPCLGEVMMRACSIFITIYRVQVEIK
jgi:hypothetical protein